MNGKFLYYSTQCELAHNIAKKYYKQFYVFCTEEYAPLGNPVSSRPDKNFTLFKDIVDSRDKFNVRVKTLKQKLTSVALAKKNNGQITQAQYNAILWEVRHAQTDEFAPLVYLILRDKVQGRVQNVPPQSGGLSYSIEYIIEDLRDDEFEMIALY